MRCRPNELIVASPGAGRPAPRPWTLVQRAYRCRLQRCSATRRLTTRCWKRANFLVVLGGAPGAAAKLTRFVLPRVEPYGSPRGYDSGSVRQPRVRPCRHVSGIGPASLGRLPASVQPTADADGPFSRFPASPATPELPVQQTRSHSGNAPLSMFRAVPSASCGNGRAPELAPLDAPESRPYVGSSGPAGHSVRACVGLADAVDAEGLGGDPPPAPDPNGLLYAALDDTTAGPANVPRPASGRAEPASTRTCYLVDPASSHMLVSKIKPCMCKYEQVQTVKLRMAH
ncbi:hornerin-like [Iris pallida]|nr:hornerin-like [Iris pallida]KAJ6850783.1 hornerin-like [Iris pallida]